MTGLSSIIKNGQTLQAQAGPLAIAAGDLTLMAASLKQAFAAKVSDYAAVGAQGNAVVATTSFGYIKSSYLNWRKAVLINAADGAIFAAGAYSNGTYGEGLNVTKYSTLGVLIAQVTLDVTASQTTAATIVQLSNGNLAVTWGIGVLHYFAILDQNLNVIVAKTSTGIIGGGNNSYLPDTLALSGGGFIVSGQLGNSDNTSFVIYSNAGAVTKALTSITNSPAAGSGVYSKLVQLANGNIVIALSALTGAKFLGFAIYDPTGTVKVAYTAVNTTASTFAQPPDISVIGNIFCLCWNDDTNATAYVYSNAAGTTAVLQGGAYSVANASPVNVSLKMLNDGVGFWFIYSVVTTSKAAIAYIPVTGTNFVTTTTTAAYAGSATSMAVDACFDHGLLITATVGANGVNVFSPDSTSHSAGPIVSFTYSLRSAIGQLIASNDFSILEASQYQLCVQKYLSTFILGIAQQAVAAGNAGTLFPINSGPGSYPTNHIAGSPGVTFTGPSGRGAIYPDAVTITPPRNIN